MLAHIDRINALMKRLIPESANYSVEYTEALLKIIKELNKKVEVLVPANQRKEAKTVVKNVFNQDYEVIKNFPMPGIMYQFAIGIKI